MDLEAARRHADAVVEALASTAADFKRMPFFVRPMVKSGFTKRSGKPLADWESLVRQLRNVLAEADDAEAAGSRVASRWPSLHEELTRLAENYRRTPEVAAKFMPNGETLNRVRRSSAEREVAVRSLLETLAQESGPNPVRTQSNSAGHLGTHLGTHLGRTQSSFPAAGPGRARAPPRRPPNPE